MKISVVTPSYNQDEFLERTMLSVLSQEWDFDLQYIVMDWLSNDGSVDIMKKYDELIKWWKFEKKCNKIDFIWKTEKDNWQSHAINKGLKICTWDIVTYLNSDDTYASWTLQKVVTDLWSSDSMWSYWKCKIIDKDDKEIRKWITFYKDLLCKRYGYGKLISENFISQMTVFWKREILEEVWYFNEDEHLCMDYEYWLRIWSKYDPIYIHDYLANFRRYPASKSGSRYNKQFQDELRIAEKYADGKYRFYILLHKFNYYKITFVYKMLDVFRV